MWASNTCPQLAHLKSKFGIMTLPYHVNAWPPSKQGSNLDDSPSDWGAEPGIHLEREDALQEVQPAHQVGLALHLGVVAAWGIQPHG